MSIAEWIGRVSLSLFIGVIVATGTGYWLYKQIFNPDKQKEAYLNFYNVVWAGIAGISFFFLTLVTGEWVIFPIILIALVFLLHAYIPPQQKIPKQIKASSKAKTLEMLMRWLPQTGLRDKDRGMDILFVYGVGPSLPGPPGRSGTRFASLDEPSANPRNPRHKLDVYWRKNRSPWSSTVYINSTPKPSDWDKAINLLLYYTVSELIELRDGAKLAERAGVPANMTSTFEQEANKSIDVMLRLCNQLVVVNQQNLPFTQIKDRLEQEAGKLWTLVNAVVNCRVTLVEATLSDYWSTNPKALEGLESRLRTLQATIRHMEMSHNA